MNKEKASLNWIIAAGVVGADIGTSVFYGTGILFPIVGYLAPVLILCVCLMMWWFKSTYQEGIALSPYNGGAYVMILRSVGRRPAVLVGALTILSYLATAAVSSLAGSHYLSSLMNGLSETSITLFAFLPIIFFGLLNIKGIKEPAKIVTVIAIFHFALLIIIDIWGLGYILLNDIEWSKMTLQMPVKLTFPLIIYGLAAAFLGISGFESAAQIVEELKEPIHETVRKLYKAVVILVSLTAPAISFLCLAILSPQEVQTSGDYLLAGLGDKLGGDFLKTTVVVDATLTLFAATNTAYVGFIGLATTMAKQGNLPQILLKRIAHRYPNIQGYPLIALPFMGIAIVMTAFVTGKIEVLGQVYGMAFLGVMVSFAIGVVLMRNEPMRRDVPKQYLTKVLIQLGRFKAPLIPLISAVILGIAQVVLITQSPLESRFMLIELLSLILFAMAFYRWGVLEKRLESRTDLRLGLGKFRTYEDLPDDLQKYLLCAGGTGARRLITKAVRFALKDAKEEPFELIIFHAEEGKDPKGFFAELLQRVISQQVEPIFADRDIILTCKILPGPFVEEMKALKKSVKIDKIIIGTGRNPRVAQELRPDVEETFEMEVVQLPG